MKSPSLPRLAARWPRATIALHLLVAAAGAVGFAKLRQTDDLLDFVPNDEPEVRAFREVSGEFGALDVAVIGVTAPDGDDVFSPLMLEKLDAAAKALKSVHGVDRVTSMATLPDFTPGDDMVQVSELIDLSHGPPRTAEERAALRAKVMSRAHVVGNFVSRDGRSALLLVFLASGARTRSISHELHAAAQGALGDLHAVYGGLPFAASSIYEEAQTDIRRLTPIAALLILAVIVFVFRDPVGVALTVVAVGWASLVLLGGMGAVDEPFTVVSATLPVILFASGSSYAVHVLGRFYADGGSASGEGAIVRAAETVQPPVAIAGLTTAAGFLSFLVMDIRPMRAFGLECAAGVILCLIASLSLVPAVITLFPRKKWRPAPTGRLGDGLAAIGRWSIKRRWILVVGSAALGCATIGPMLRVSVRMEPSNFFRKGSEPWQAEHFLDDQFGGSKFVEVEVAGDMADPATLIELERLGEFARALPSVTQVASVVQPLGLVNDAMGGGRRLPETRAQAANLLFFLEGDAAFRSLLTPARDRALVHVRVRGDAQPTVDAVQEYVDARLKRTPGAPTPAEVAERLGWIASAAGAALPKPTLARAAESMLRPLPAGADPAARARADKMLDGDGGFLAKVTDEAARARLEEAVAKGDPAAAKAALAEVAPSPDEAQRAWEALDGDLKALAREAKVARALAELSAPSGGGAGPAWPPELTDQARDALCGLAPVAPIAPAPRALTARLAGEPVLDRGFSRSVAHNQEKSLAVSLAVVILLMFVLFRSPYLALVSVFPSALAMAFVFGAMGLLHVRIDLSTSLVASIATGAGSDFAMHYLWYLKRSTPDEVVRFVGPVMVVSSLLVAAGFAVLAVGQSQPMRMFGSLAALAMAGAALLTFLLVPALLRRVDRPPAPGGGRVEGSA